MWRVLVTSLLAACGFQISTGTPSDDQPILDGNVDAIDSAPPQWLTGYTHRKRLVVNSGQSIDLTDFVVGVVLPADAGLAAHARDDGQDITVTTADDAILDCELERFDGGTGELVLWVRVPTLASATTLYLYYGGEIRLHDARATWAAQTFRAVWHLADGMTTQARDSAGMHDLASAGATNQPTPETGLAGSARGLDGLNDSLRDNADDATLDFGTGSFSWSVWVNVTQSAGDFDMPMYKGGSLPSDEGWDVELGFNGWRTFISDGSDVYGAVFGNETLNTWVHLTGVCDRDAQLLRAYTNGVQADAVDIATAGSVSSNQTFVIGSSSGNLYWFRGRIDEPRIYARALSPEWIAAEHANLRSPSAFVTASAEEAAP